MSLVVYEGMSRLVQQLPTPIWEELLFELYTGWPVSGASLHTQDKDLYYVCRYGDDLQRVQQLIQQGADPNWKNSDMVRLLPF